ncbi:MAG: DUF1653 domain-containing protein [Gammaproteobacteria bacterium]|jgi:hypothetical protein|nr:DUF1653 domain-containing protein [Gammaproteobacteria bacterium]
MTDITIKPGIYRHFKGQRYQVMELVTHSETEQTLVLYRALYGERGLWVRPVDLFLGSKQVDGVAVPRFTYEGPEPDASQI